MLLKVSDVVYQQDIFPMYHIPVLYFCNIVYYSRKYCLNIHSDVNLYQKNIMNIIKVDTIFTLQAPDTVSRGLLDSLHLHMQTDKWLKWLLLFSSLFSWYFRFGITLKLQTWAIYQF